jgi:hypothetical protein
MRRARDLGALRHAASSGRYTKFRVDSTRDDETLRTLDREDGKEGLRK